MDRPALEVAIGAWLQACLEAADAVVTAPPGRVLIAAQYRPGQPATPTMAEILQVQAAWAAAGG